MKGFYDDMQLRRAKKKICLYLAGVAFWNWRAFSLTTFPVTYKLELK